MELLEQHLHSGLQPVGGAFGVGDPSALIGSGVRPGDDASVFGIQDRDGGLAASGSPVDAAASGDLSGHGGPGGGVEDQCVGLTDSVVDEGVDDRTGSTGGDALDLVTRQRFELEQSFGEKVQLLAMLFQQRGCLGVTAFDQFADFGVDLLGGGERG